MDPEKNMTPEEVALSRFRLAYEKNRAMRRAFRGIRTRRSARILRGAGLALAAEKEARS